MSVTRSKLSKISRDIYRLEPHKPPTRCLRRINFLHMSFNETEERLFVIDVKGIGYLLELIFNAWNYRKVGSIGQSTFVAFNPNNKSEVLVGLTSTDVKIIKIKNNSVDNFCLLRGHELPPTSVSFYENYCLTSSRKEAIVWDLKSCMKIHQLRVERNKSRIKKASFSSSGLVVALYENDTIQAWRFEDLNFHTRVCLCDHKLKNIKDFIFTKNGRSLIVCGSKKKIIVLDTKSWALIKSFELVEKSSVARRLAVVPISLDAGANNIISVLFEDGSVMFLDLHTGTFVETVSNFLTGIKKIIVSTHGQWTASIHFDGSLIVSGIDRLINIEAEQVKIKSITPQPEAHCADEHLEYIEKNMGVSVKFSRLIPILREYGEYPERYRSIIWRKIMKLPSNRQASAALDDKIPMDSKSKLLENYQLADKTKANLLALTVHRLVQFCPMLEQCSFLPELIFPFIVVFQKDPLLAFEAASMILWNYCQNWFEYHPFPPLNILGIIENILMKVDPVLLKFYCDHGITSIQYAWSLLKSTMSEVLSGNEWLILWDNILTHKKPSLLILCVVAYNICCRGITLTFLKNKKDIDKYFGRQGQVSVNNILNIAHQLDGDLSEKYHPSKYFRDDFCYLPTKGPYPPFLIHEYPKFVIENPSKMTNLDVLKEQEARLIEKRRQATRVTQDKQLREECDDFLKQVHQHRLQEIQKVCDERMRVKEMSLASEREKYRYQFPQRLKPVEIISPCEKSCRKSKTEETTSSYRKLRNDVQELVGEVQTFLKSMRNSRR